jgi:glutathionyl-hydroquinone reductase
MAKFLLVDGKWTALSSEELAQKNSGGAFVRAASQFRSWITKDGLSGFAAEPNRYHLYISLACPWACRTYLYLKLKRLEHVISVSIVNPKMGNESWTFEPDAGVVADSVNGAMRMHEIYTKADPTYSGRVTVPVLWDKKTNTIVSNESSEIIRMLNSEFDHLAEGPSADYYPEPLREAINAMNEKVYPAINNGVYRAGFATSQQAYEEAYDLLFDTLDEIEALLGRQRYLVGNSLTEADWRIFTTLVRFDAVYYGHFKCNKRRLIDYPNIWAYLRELYQHPHVAETVDFYHIKTHYYWSHTSINPTQVVPKGPELNFLEPHNRDKQQYQQS